MSLLFGQQQGALTVSAPCSNTHPTCPLSTITTFQMHRLSTRAVTSNHRMTFELARRWDIPVRGGLLLTQSFRLRVGVCCFSGSSSNLCTSCPTSAPPSAGARERESERARGYWLQRSAAEENENMIHLQSSNRSQIMTQIHRKCCSDHVKPVGGSVAGSRSGSCGENRKREERN
ncbi:hypothetical protein JOB18_023469 [Solea senegalensis]|uniref:Uncharacterized protein n=2 Tax=Solea senegalensis TaxID=28829 RepID=A0AAV6PHD6_SOLSE|nr:hypothetical protein JOB18_023469 [Solea senegalensis]KAG7464225.1 hypothetical protein JOB18_023469 [Solea senegalensis]